MGTIAAGSSSIRARITAAGGVICAIAAIVRRCGGTASNSSGKVPFEINPSKNFFYRDIHDPKAHESVSLAKPPLSPDSQKYGQAIRIHWFCYPYSLALLCLAAFWYQTKLKCEMNSVWDAQGGVLNRKDDLRASPTFE